MVKTGFLSVFFIGGMAFGIMISMVAARSETKPSEMSGEEQIKCIRDAPEYDRSIPAVERAAKRKQFREDCISKLRAAQPTHP